jgi:23S rRNA (uracil1939-C5)-methyltransferase
MARKKGKQRNKEEAIENVLQIEELGWHGDGIADVNGKRVFVPFTLAGESVRAMVTGSRAKVLEILYASPDRIEAQCGYYSKCGGCGVQHIAFETYCQWKRQIVERALLNRHIEAPVEALIDGHGSGRRRVTLHVQYIDGQVQAGFMQAHSHSLVDIKSCPILAPELAKATDISRDVAGHLLNTSKALNIQLTVSETGLDCTIMGAGKLDLDARMGLSDCANDYDLARLSVSDDMILERRAPILVFGAGKVVLPPGGFLQATLSGEEILSNIVLDGVSGAKKIADLYCGLGPFSLRMAAHSPVMSFDSDEVAIAALQVAAHHVQGQKPVTAKTRDLSENPLHSSELNLFDAVVFDPPRAGAEAQAREIASSKVTSVIAVSCNAATFARDASILIDGGYRLEKVSPVDQFRFTGHVEMVGVFKRG